MVTLFSSTLTLVGVVVIMLVLDVQLALVVFLTLPLLAIASLVFRIVAAERLPDHARADRGGDGLPAGDA